jgi:hypothetical protein
MTGTAALTDFVFLCEHQEHAGSLDFGPAEFCDRPANADGLCALHGGGDPDAAYELLVECEL